MTAFVIMAAGRGTRVGRVGGNLHKALLPLGGKAVLSHLFELAPAMSHLIVCVGDRAQQLRDYVELAHPDLDVTFVNVHNWKGPGSGPGRSLLAASDAVGSHDMLFTSCDTLWTRTSPLSASRSWAAYAPMPAGTDPERWCRFDVRDDTIVDILDKEKGTTRVSNVYTGLAYVKSTDLHAFWEGIAAGEYVDDELQVTDGLRAIGQLGAQRIDWIDTGDEAAYRRAVAQFAGYDWTKTDQATYVLPESRRVVKYMADESAITARNARGFALSEAVPTRVARRGNMLAYQYVNGETVYERLERDDDVEVTRRLLEWREHYLTNRVHRSPLSVTRAVIEFYRNKTLDRIALLHESLQRQAYDAVTRVNFDELAPGFEAGIPHGDLNYGNVIITLGDEYVDGGLDYDFVGIDWREDFAGRTWFDLRYDVAKLLAGTVVHWGRARRGDFTPWDAGLKHGDVIRGYLTDSNNTLHDVEIIAALSLLNSAPLHAEPLDEILVARGCAWLERLT